MTQEKGGDGAERIRDGFDERRGSPGDSVSNESTFNADLGLTPGLGKSPGGGHGNPLHYSCLENPDEQRSMVGFIGVTELDATEGA